MNHLENLLKKINVSKQIDFGTIINDAIELYKKVWLKGFLLMLLVMVSAVLITFAFRFIGLAASPFNINNGFNPEILFNFISQNAIYSLPQTILISTMSLALVAAFYRICKQVDNGENSNDDYFYFLNKDSFKKVLMLGIIHAAITTVSQLLFLIPYIYAYVPLAYFAMVLAENPDLNETDIVKASFAIGNKKWLVTFGCLVVTTIMAMLGVLACGIGLLFTVPIIYLPIYLIYKDVVGFKNHSEIDEIGIGSDLNQ